MIEADLCRRTLAAAATIREAGRLARRYFDRRDQIEVELKGMQDLVSVADRTTEELIRARLGAAFPDDAFIGEEGGADDVPEEAGKWVIDPIDGTMNVLRGVPYWSVVIAYVKGRDVLIGTTYDPVHDDLYVAMSRCFAPSPRTSCWRSRRRSTSSRPPRHPTGSIASSSAAAPLGPRRLRRC